MTDRRVALCPCCQFPTLTENGYYEICLICWWEDDGQNEKNADKAYGGPNGDYSLTNARKNFAHHAHMYDEGKGITAVEQPSPTRRALIDYLQGIDFDPQLADANRLSELLNADHRQLDHLDE